MGYIIAVAGKGGTGKSTLAALTVRLLKEKKAGSILAIDADPNSNLAELLGLGVQQTIGTILDDIAKHPDQVPSGMTKDRFIEYQVQTAILEGDGFDILTMGKPEGPGCYCYVNNVLRNVVSRLLKDYAYIVVDNEAGLEHLSRRTTRSADTLLVVSDATPIGLKAAKRINELVKELDIKTTKKLLLINRYEESIDKSRLEGIGLDFIGQVPVDEDIVKISFNGNSLMGLKDDCVSIRVLRKIGDKIWQLN